MFSSAGISLFGSSCLSPLSFLSSFLLYFWFWRPFLAYLGRRSAVSVRFGLLKLLLAPGESDLLADCFF